MKKTLMTMSSLLAVTALAACNKQAEAPKPAESAAANSNSMSAMPMAAAMKHDMAVGTVTAIDPAKSTITLDHGAMSNLGWPAMTMGFTAKPELLSGIKVGDKVDFEIDWDGKAGAITKIAKSGT